VLLISDCRIELRRRGHGRRRASLSGRVHSGNRPAHQRPGDRVRHHTAPRYVAQPSTAAGNYTAAFRGPRTDDKDTVSIGSCTPGKARFTQAELNGYAPAEWASEIRTAFSRLYDIISLDRFEHAGALGSVVVADRKMPPGTPPRAVRSRLAVVLETPKADQHGLYADKPSFGHAERVRCRRRSGLPAKIGATSTVTPTHPGEVAPCGVPATPIQCTWRDQERAYKEDRTCGPSHALARARAHLAHDEPSPAASRIGFEERGDPLYRVVIERLPCERLLVSMAFRRSASTRWRSA